MTRLIDADALIKTLNEKNIPVDVRVNYEIMNAPTIEPDGDLISRREAILAITGEPPEAHYPSWYADRIKALPSAPDSRQRGEWVYGIDDETGEEDCYPWTCSVCNKEYPWQPNFCPNCGADMRGGEE